MKLSVTAFVLFYIINILVKKQCILEFIIWVTNSDCKVQLITFYNRYNENYLQKINSFVKINHLIFSLQNNECKSIK